MAIGRRRRVSWRIWMRPGGRATARQAQLVVQSPTTSMPHQRRLILAAVVVVVLAPFANGCLPGYEAERDRLREHLGIEWLQNGLDKTAWSDKPIRHTSDLNCEFSEPEKCRWKNMGDEHHMDSIDFFLFEKIDYTEFPALRVGPGPTKVRQGDKMILTGNKKREEQHAILYSSPINCQNSTGNLTFTYWVYNGARVEVILVEDDPVTKGYKMVFENPEEEKPYVDCGTIQLNTECHADIPPRDKPFRIGIRAYDMANTEGSFVIIDNIIYSASLCKVGIDLGDDFQTSSLQTGATGQPIGTAADLDCDEFDENCRWRSTGGDVTSMWRRSSSMLPQETLINATGTAVGPRGSYAVLYIEQDTKKSIDVLRSDQISCQSNTENALSFRFWKFGEFELEACAVDMMLHDIECVHIPRASSPANVSASFHTAENNFMLTIRVSNFNDDFDNMLIIDDIIYRATLCSDALSVFDVGEHFVSTPMLSILLNRNIHTSKDLWCDFSKRASSCMWGMLNENQEDQEIAATSWAVGHGPLNSEKLYSLTGVTDMPDGEFGVAKFETAGAAILLSEVIKCAQHNVNVQFRLWTTGSAILKVCLVEESSPSLLDCQSASTGAVVVDLPPIKRSFRIAFHAESVDQGMVIVDDIVVQGDVCPPNDVAARQFAAKSFRPNSELPDPNVCRLLSCAFRSAHACLYEASQVSHSAYYTVSRNELTAYLTRSKKVFILESPQFHLNTIARLHFNYELQGDVSLFICNDSGTKELESCFKVDGASGDDFIELLASDTKVYIIVRLTETGHSGSLKLTRIQLTDTNDQPVC